MLLKHSLLYLFARGIPGIINFLAIAVYTRLLTPDEYGRYALVIAWVGLGNAVIFQWLRLSLLRYLPAFQEERETFLSTVLVAFFGLALVIAAPGLLLAAFWPDPTLRSIVALGVILLLAQAWHELNLELLRSQLEPLRYGVISLVKALISLGLGWFLAIHGTGAWGLLIGLIIGLTISTVDPIRREWAKINPRWYDRKALRLIKGYGIPLTATFALNFVIGSSDRIILGLLKGSEAAGLYAVGYDVAQQSLGVLMMVVNLAAYPLAVQKLERDGDKAAKAQLSQNLTFLSAVVVPATVGMIILSKDIAFVFMGEHFRSAGVAIMPLVAIGILISGIKSYYFDLAFQLGGKTMPQVWASFGAAVVNIALNLLWIPWLGVIGAAHATIASFAIALAFSWFLGKGIFRLPNPSFEIAKAGFATLVMSIALLLLPFHGSVMALGINVLLGAAIYIVMIVVLNVAGLREIILGMVRQSRRS